jgi:molybdenum cofactor guanylyltransferase
MATASRTLGVILAGGEGRRVGGRDKGLLPLQGQPVVARVLSVLGPQCDETLIVANRNHDKYAKFARVIGDEVPGHAGPLAGIAATLTLIVEREPERFGGLGWLLTAPADCPDPPQDLFTRLHAALRSAPDALCTYARDAHKLQPLFALYALQFREALLDSAREALNVHASPLRWHMELDAVAVDFSDRAEAFRNLNTLEDFQDYERLHP